LGRGKTVVEAVKKIGVTEQTYYRWKKQYGGLRIDQAKRRLSYLFICKGVPDNIRSASRESSRPRV